MLQRFSQAQQHKLIINTSSSCCTTFCVVLTESSRSSSSAFLRNHELNWKRTFTYDRPYGAASYPDGSMHHVHPGWKNKLRKTVYEWRNYYGHGQKVAHLGPSREIPDWEHADGTPAPHSGRRFTLLSHKQDMLAQIIRAGAIVERMARDDQLPRIPGSDAQRDWDPEIPLFLEDDDERGGTPAPEWFVSPRKLSAISRDGFSKSARKFPDNPAEAGKSDVDAETLKPLEPLADYEPTSFIHEPLPLNERKKRPHWDRRLWSLTDEFLIEKPLRNKNTIGSD